jgi:hypothetical protein
MITNMIRRLTIASTLVFAGSISCASSAFAQYAPTTAEIPFEGNVPGACTFSNIKPGILNLNVAGTGLGTNSSYYPNGVAGNFDITCTASATLSVADPIQSSGPVTTNNLAEMNGTTLPNQAFSPAAGGANVSVQAGFSSNNGNIWLNMDASDPNGKKLLGGVYKYKVIVTATPN